MDRPLAGRRILVTRAAHQASTLSERLFNLDAEPIEVPLIEIQPPASFEPLDRALLELSQYGWLILTSANAVRMMASRAPNQNLRSLVPGSLKVAAVGRSTAEAARKEGLHVARVPDVYVAESLVDDLLPDLSGERCLLIRAAIARDVIPGSLREAGAKVDVVDAYHNALPESAPEMLKRALLGRIDAVTFTSSSSVTHLLEAARLSEIEFPFAGVAAISIGPVTSQTLREMGWPPAAQARRPDIDWLVHEVAEYFKAQQ
jgi:uroporphyrinogen-III synthase